MKKKPKRKHSRSSDSHRKEKPYKPLPVSIIITIRNNNDSSDHLTGSIKKIKPKYYGYLEFIIVAERSCVELSEDIVNEINTLQDISSTAVKKVITEDNYPVSGMISLGIEHATNDFITFINLSDLTGLVNFNMLFINRDIQAGSDTVYAFYPESNNRKYGQFSGPPAWLILSKDVGMYVFSNLISKSGHITDICYLLNRLDISIIKYSHSGTSSSSIAEKKIIKFHNYLSGKLIRRIILWIKWHICVPVHEIKTRPEKKYSFFKQSSVYRLIFVSLSIILFFLMPFLGYHAGISADEIPHYKQAEKVINYRNYRLIG